MVLAAAVIVERSGKRSGSMDVNKVGGRYDRRIVWAMMHMCERAVSGRDVGIWTPLCLLSFDDI